MKLYFKVLAITSSLLLFGFFTTYFLDWILSSTKSSSILPFCVGAVFLLTSNLLGILLPVLWGNNAKQKIAIILLLPTNYSIAITIIVIFVFVDSIINVLISLPSNIGWYIAKCIRAILIQKMTSRSFKLSGGHYLSIHI